MSFPEPVAAADHLSTRTQPIAQHQRRRREVPMPVIYAIGILALIVAFAVGYGTALASPPAPARESHEPLQAQISRVAQAPLERTIAWYEGLEPCATEDSTACYWDAETMGNGLGRSFVVDGQGTVTYVTPEELP